MAKAIDHINAALQLLGVSSAIRPAPPQMIATALSVYNDMIARWVEDGIEVGAIQVTAPGEETQNYQWAASSIQYSLAVEVAPRAQVDVPSAVLAGQVRLYAEMRERARLGEVIPGRAKVDPRLPVGSGNSRGGRYSRRFYRS